MGKPDDSVRSLNKFSDFFEYVFFELYILVINFIKSPSTFLLIIISEPLVTISLLKPVNWFKSIVKLPYLPSSVSLYECLFFWKFNPVPTIEEEYNSNLFFYFF